MMIGNTRVTSYRRSLFLTASMSILLAVIGTLGVLSWAGWLAPPRANPQAMVHDMSQQVP